LQWKFVHPLKQPWSGQSNTGSMQIFVVHELADPASSGVVVVPETQAFRTQVPLLLAVQSWQLAPPLPQAVLSVPTSQVPVESQHPVVHVEAHVDDEPPSGVVVVALPSTEASPGEGPVAASPSFDPLSISASSEVAASSPVGVVASSD
jgi:hypothetical protein